MTKPSIAFAIAAAALLSTVACEDTQVKDEAEDVKGAKQDVKEEKGEVAEEKAEFSAELKQRIDDAEKRYTELEKRAPAIKATSAGAAAETEISKALATAKTRIEAVRKATATTIERDLEQLEDAMDSLDATLDKYDDAAATTTGGM